MSDGSENVTYLDKLLNLFPSYKKSDFFSLILCGTDLENPYAGLSGICCDSVFDESLSFRSYFGDFPDSLIQYENVAEFLIDRSKSKLAAIQEFFVRVSSLSENPVFISSNGGTWTLPALQSANDNLMVLDRLEKFQVLDLRKLYSFVTNKKTEFQFSFLGKSMDDCPSIPKTFGLFRMAGVWDIRVPDSGTKAEQRSRLTAELSAALFREKFPKSSSRDEDETN